MFCIKFSNNTIANEFKEAFETSVKFNKNEAVEPRTIEDIEDVRETNIKNVTADPDGEWKIKKSKVNLIKKKLKYF